MKKIKIEDTIYTANTDFRIVLKCNEIAQDNTIGDYERVLGILCTFYGPDALDNPNHYEKLLKWALNYFSCGKEIIDRGQPDMDYKEDMNYIKSSFKYDYGYNPYEMEYLSWEDFYNDLNNLSSSEFGICCILNRIRMLRNLDLSTIKDDKERQKMAILKEEVALKKTKKENNLTEEQEKSMEEFNRLSGL